MDLVAHLQSDQGGESQGLGTEIRGKPSLPAGGALPTGGGWPAVDHRQADAIDRDAGPQRQTFHGQATAHHQAARGGAVTNFQHRADGFNDSGKHERPAIIAG
jgi:hypothetical protein